MTDVHNHYNDFLADYYSWMFGNFEIKVQSNYDFFVSKGVLPLQSKIAIDLGAGSGFQSLALARLGFKVTAIDLCQKLLDELKGKAGELPIKTINANILEIAAHCNGDAELITCMGDTLTHLLSIEQVEILLKEVHRSLSNKGKFILAFRDYSREFTNTDRFVPVYSDENTILTCFLEYEPEKVKVFDIVYEKRQDKWQLRKSFYRKLRLFPEALENQLEKNGFAILNKTASNGMIEIVASKLS